MYIYIFLTMIHSLHKAEKTVLIFFNTRAAHGKYFKATTFI